MLDALGDFFSTNGFMPHGHCYLWKPGLVWLHFTSDILIGLAYIFISISLYALVKKIRLPFSAMFLAFGAFIGFCGATHFMSVWTLWTPDYWLSGAVKFVTAFASVATGVLMFPVRPKVIELANAAKLSEERRIQLETANAELRELNAKIKEVDELKNQFFANVSHELRTPLALIIGPAETMAEDSSLSVEKREKMETIARNGRSLLKQVNDLLDIAKLEAGQMTPDYVDTDLARLVRVTAANFESLMASRGLTFTVDSPGELHAQVDVDKVQRILMNLISNAFKFVPKGGRVECELSRNNGFCVIRVQDNGPGVPESDRELIFERFRQGVNAPLRKAGGTGLGLAIVKDFVEMHEGTVVVKDSSLGGACFEVRLPLKAPAGVRVSSESAVSAIGEKINVRGTVDQLQVRHKSESNVMSVEGRPMVLVVEDNVDMNQYITEMLSKEFNVLTAFNGKDGLSKALSIMPDLIVSDIMMPEMSGDELVKQLREHREMDGIPVLLLSAKADDELRVRLLADGAQDYLVKPFEAHELCVRTRNLVQMKRTRQVLERELTVKSGNVEHLAEEVARRKRELEVALSSMRVAREEAERANQVKSNFLSLISHELKTPLTTIALNLELMRKHSNDKLERLVQRSSGAARHLENLVDGLLEYTGLERGKLAIERTPTNIEEMVRQSAEQLEVQARQKGLDFRLSLKGAVPPLTTDARLVRIILNNLVGNAIKFTTSGWVEVMLDYGPRGHVLSVRDTGPGIPMADQDRIFEPFEQLEPLRRKSVPGVGLGLALVRELANALDGKIEVQSEEGTGSVFSVTFPAPRA